MEIGATFCHRRNIDQCVNFVIGCYSVRNTTLGHFQWAITGPTYAILHLEASLFSRETNIGPTIVAQHHKSICVSGFLGMAFGRKSNVGPTIVVQHRNSTHLRIFGNGVW
jgi:hypothetical protein